MFILEWGISYLNFCTVVCDTCIIQVLSDRCIRHCFCKIIILITHNLFTISLHFQMTGRLCDTNFTNKNIHKYTSKRLLHCHRFSVLNVWPLTIQQSLILVYEFFCCFFVAVYVSLRFFLIYTYMPPLIWHIIQLYSIRL